jgi:hypothetical protein
MFLSLSHGMSWLGPVRVVIGHSTAASVLGRYTRALISAVLFLVLGPVAPLAGARRLPDILDRSFYAGV